MTLTLIIISQLCIIFAVYGLVRARDDLNNYTLVLQRDIIALGKRITDLPPPNWKAFDEAMEGKVKQVRVEAKIAEKMADRAFNMASTANLGVVALQKALAQPRLLTKPQVTQNQVASEGVNRLFNTGGSFDWLKPILSDEDLEVIEEIERKKEEQMNGNHED